MRQRQLDTIKARYMKIRKDAGRQCFPLGAATALLRMQSLSSCNLRDALHMH